ncbi:hypothetical protein B566_EDAN004677 [Ephemera danica]|nr:hypothetical protein B566_EDAN004677 [Ephemera danica]
MRGGNVKKTRLQQVDKLTKELVKRWMWLPKRASNEVVYLLPSEGGAGCLPLGDNCDLLSIVHGYRLLTCRDAATREVAWNVLGAVVRRKIGRPANKTDICRYLSGDLAGEFGRDGGDIASLWSRVRNASRRLAPRIHLNWSWSTEENELHLHLINPLHPGDTRLFINPQTRMHCCRNLRDAVRGTYKQRLFRKPDQGKVYDVTTQSSHSNHMLRSGRFTRFADWRFLHRARLGVVPLNATRRFGALDKRCRRCNHPTETLPHVLNHCGPLAGARTHRHDTILQRIARAVPPRMGTVRINRIVPGIQDTGRPDLVVLNEAKKKAYIVDVAIPFENRPTAMAEARRIKKDKYSGTADRLRARGYEVEVDALVIGALGGWDPANEITLRMLKVNQKYALLMRRLMISDCIRWSRDMYVEHVTGTRQYQRPGPPRLADGAPNGEADNTLDGHDVAPVGNVAPVEEDRAAEPAPAERPMVTAEPVAEPAAAVDSAAVTTAARAPQPPRRSCPPSPPHSSWIRRNLMGLIEDSPLARHRSSNPPNASVAISTQSSIAPVSISAQTQAHTSSPAHQSSSNSSQAPVAISAQFHRNTLYSTDSDDSEPQSPPPSTVARFHKTPGHNRR